MILLHWVAKINQHENVFKSLFFDCRLFYEKAFTFDADSENESTVIKSICKQNRKCKNCLHTGQFLPSNERKKHLKYFNKADIS